MEVRRRKTVSRSTFRHLPFGAIYYTGTGTGPFVKTGFRTQLPTNVIAQQQPTQTAVADTSIAVIRAERFLVNTQNQI